ncbi:hypothetical protein D3C76_922540 [compost metagenome]
MQVFDVVRQFNLRHQRQPLGVGQHTVRVFLEVTGTGIGDIAVAGFHLEKALSGDGDVQRLSGVLDVAGGELFLRADNFDASTELNTRRRGVVLVKLTARRALILIEQIGEHYAIALKPGGVDVRQVIGDGAHLRVLRGKTGFTDP